MIATGGTEHATAGRRSSGRAVCRLIAAIGLPVLLAACQEPPPPPPPPQSQCLALISFPDDCFAVTGRVYTSTQSPRVRIRPNNSNRVMTVPDELEGTLPSGLRAVLDPQKFLLTQMTVCPLEPERVGRMRRVCVNEASVLRFIPR